MPDLPTGTVTFLFTDLESSTRLWEDERETMAAAVARHDALLRDAVESHAGHVIKGTGDGLHAVFATADAGVGAAVSGQRALAAEPWGPVDALRVRMGLHTGVAEQRGGDYFGPVLNRAARLMAVAHGGQVVISGATAALVGDDLSEGVGLVDLGEHRLRDLARPMHVFQVVHPSLPRDFPPLQSLDALPGNLPVQRTMLIGRERDVEQLVTLVGTERLVTLTGVGGVGKTRLALQVAAESLDESPDGVWLVPLATVSDPALVPAAAVGVLGLTERPGRSATDALCDALRSKSSLFVLDNCEHVIDAVAALADVLLDACPGLRLLATSREPLGVAGEQVRRTASLAVPEPTATTDAMRQSSAVRLFADRTHAVRPEFDLDDDQTATVRQICARLDGIPLAIELAAARVSVMTPTDVLARLDERFLVLTGGSRTALERHQTLRAAVDWSYSLLADGERTIFARLSVFAGGFDLEAAEAVAGGDGVDAAAVLDGLTSLVAKSMVQVDESGASARYGMLETLRQYARDRLAESGEAPRIRTRHAMYFLGFMRDLSRELASKDEFRAIERRDIELDNLRAAFDWLVETGDATTAIDLVLAQGDWWANVREGLDRYEAALAIADDLAPAVRAPAYAVTAWLAVNGGQHGRAIELGEASVRGAAEAGMPPPSNALCAIGIATFWRGEPRSAVAWLEQAVEAARTSGEPNSLAASLGLLSFGLDQIGETSPAIAAGEEALAIARASAGPSLLSASAQNLGMAYRSVDIDRARALLDEALENTRPGDRSSYFGWRLLGAAQVRAAAHDDRGALELFVRTLDHARELGDRFTLPTTFQAVARLLARHDRPEAATRLLAAAERARADLGQPGGPQDTDARDRTAARLRVALGEAAFAAEWEAGQALGLDAASDLARAEAIEIIAAG
jgi:predicted ATPase/class 3 adenylate cyclase